MVASADGRRGGGQNLEVRQRVAAGAAQVGLRISGNEAVASDSLHTAFDALWSALRARELGQVTPTHLSREIRALAFAARRAGLRAEQFVGLVKASWTALPDVRAAADPLRTRELLSGIVTICIHEFYDD